jgi:hypothetical protein
MSEQALVTELLFNGAPTTGSYQRRMNRLAHFIERNHSVLYMRESEARRMEEYNQRAKFNQSHRSPDWALNYLRNYKTNSLTSIASRQHARTNYVTLFSLQDTSTRPSQTS